MENRVLDSEGTDLNIFHSVGHFYFCKAGCLKGRYLFLSQTTPNFEETDRLGALVLSPAQIDFLLGVMEFALPHGEAEHKKELQAYYRLLLDLRDGLAKSTIDEST